MMLKFETHSHTYQKQTTITITSYNKLNRPIEFLINGHYLILFIEARYINALELLNCYLQLNRVIIVVLRLARTQQKVNAIKK